MNDGDVRVRGHRLPAGGRRGIRCALRAALTALVACVLLAPQIASAGLAAPGDVLVIATGESPQEPGGLLRVERNGMRTLASDFGDPAQGPLVARGSDVATTPSGRVLIADADSTTAPERSSRSDATVAGAWSATSVTPARGGWDPRKCSRWVLTAPSSS